MSSVPLPADSTAPTAVPVSVRRHGVLVRVTHWLNAIFLVGMIASGLQIYTSFAHMGSKGAVLPVPNPLDVSHGVTIPQAVRLGGWLAGGLRWHFTLAWPFALTGLAYLLFLIFSGEWKALVFRPGDVKGALQMMRYYLRLRPDHPPQGKHNPLQKGAYTFILVLAIISILSGFAIAKPIQLSFLTALFGGYEYARYWHMVAVWLFTGFIVVHVVMVFVADPASFRAIITGRYRGRFTSNDHA